MEKLILFFSLFINFILNQECDRYNPIKKDNSCILTYCTDEEFSDGTCEISNEIIKTQWLTNIIWIGEENSRFINFADYSNGDMIIETTSDPGNNKRIFFGLNSNGSYLFNEDESHQLILTAENQDENNGNYHKYNKIFIAEINNKEYLVSIANEEQYCELYDFEEKKIYQKKSSEALKYKLKGVRHSATKYLNQSSAFLSWAEINSTHTSFHLYLLEFKNKDISVSANLNLWAELGYPVQLGDNGIDYMTSCFVSKNDYIWTFGMIQENNKDNPNKPAVYYIFVYKPYQMTGQKKSEKIEISPFAENIFHKLVHLREDIAVGILFSCLNESDCSLVIPNFFVREYKNDEITDYLDYFVNIFNTYEGIVPFTFVEINYSYDYLLNDLIRVSDYKVAFFSMSENKETLYIFILEIYSKNEMFIGLYEIKLFVLYKYKFLSDIRLNLYNDFISFAFNFCQNEECTTSDNTHNSAFMIFGYANSTNGYLNINDYLDENPESKIKDIIIDLNKYIMIENNIFGFIFFYTEIVDLPGCDDIIFQNQNEKIIEKDSLLAQNENISIFYYKEKSFNCSIYFRPHVEDPNYEDHINYYVSTISTDFDYESKYNNHSTEYAGKLSYFNLIYYHDEPAESTESKESIEPTESSISSTYKVQEYMSTNILTQKETQNIVESTQEMLLDTTEGLKDEKSYVVTEEVANQTQKVTDKEENKETALVSEEKICSNEEVLENKCGN